MGQELDFRYRYNYKGFVINPEFSFEKPNEKIELFGEVRHHRRTSIYRLIQKICNDILKYTDRQ